MELRVEMKDSEGIHELVLKNVAKFSYENVVGFTKLRVYFRCDIDDPRITERDYRVVGYSPVMKFHSVMPD